ncbi:NADPH-dependent FMN reductase [Frankia sp. R82]|uniref:NADPH-dependent FMN reductase n=1 Tax=Frankia sp. R82 TaxID=2950553 RepID=UPI002043375E|nr:NADPH-dependent FMN reductase [Frankia sp. R82]MCM3884286.1 NAD(P)H-dependent oxidoreductase [Frankia sp. R82]
MAPIQLLLISGSTRGASTNTAALRTLAAVSPPGVATELYDGLTALPAFTPDADDDSPHPAVAGLRAAISGADAVVFCTPEYAGALPGSLKNLLDWTVGTGDLYGKSAAWINIAAPGRGAGALAELATVLRYVTVDLIESACINVPVPRDVIGADGMAHDNTIRHALTSAALTIVDHIRERSSPE